MGLSIRGEHIDICWCGCQCRWWLVQLGRRGAFLEGIILRLILISVCICIYIYIYICLIPIFVFMYKTTIAFTHVVKSECQCPTPWCQAHPPMTRLTTLMLSPPAGPKRSVTIGLISCQMMVYYSYFWLDLCVHMWDPDADSFLVLTPTYLVGYSRMHTHYTFQSPMTMISEEKIEY